MKTVVELKKSLLDITNEEIDGDELKSYLLVYRGLSELVWLRRIAHEAKEVYREMELEGRDVDELEKALVGYAKFQDVRKEGEK